MNIFKNHHIKLLSIFSALLLWLFVVGVENYVSVLPDEIPVRIINLGQNVSVASDLPTVKIKYKTPNGSVRVNSTEIDLFLDTEGLGEGEYKLPINFINKNPSVSIVALDPAECSLTLEAIATKDIKLSVDVDGQPDSEYELKSTEIDIVEVTINGAASAIESIDELPIYIALDGTETADFSRKVTLEAISDWDLAGKTISFEPETVLVDIEIRKRKVEDDSLDSNNSTTDGTDDDLSNQPIAEGNIRKNLMVQIVPEDSLRLAMKEVLPQNILLTVEGTEAEISLLNSDSIKLLLTSASVTDGQYLVSMDDIVFPSDSNLKIIKFSPEKVAVRF